MYLQERNPDDAAFFPPFLQILTHHVNVFLSLVYSSHHLVKALEG